MVDLTQIFALRSREEISALCNKIANLITPLIKNKTPSSPPIVIGITGGVNSGKSIFWDEVRRHLAGDHAIFISKLSASNEEDGRHFETWDATLLGTKQKFKMFTCNVNAIYHGSHGTLDIMSPLKEINGHKRRELGDLIILTNQHPTFIHQNAYTLFINITTLQTPPLKTWDRNIEVVIPETSPLYKSPEARKMLSLPAPK